MEGSASVGILIAFTAGLLSFLSPCVLPLIPSYISFITGMSLEDMTRARRSALLHAILFVLGFSLIFLALGATATVLGRVMHAQRDWIARAGGALIIVFGLYLLGVFNIKAFSREARVHLSDKPVGYLGTVLVGMAFGAGWTPCIGPILSSILLYTSTEADLGRGIGLLAAYSAGLAVPFLAAALAVERFFAVSKVIKRHMVWVNRVSGVLLVAIGVLLMTDYFTVLAGFLQALTPEALQKRL